MQVLRERKVLLELTEADAEQLAAGYAAGRYDRDEFNRRLGGLRRRRLGKHFEWTFDEQTEAFSSRRKEESIRAEERLDGIYVIRTSLPAYSYEFERSFLSISNTNSDLF